MNPVLVTIGKFEIRWYSALILAGVIIGYFICKKECKHLRINTEFLFNMLFWTIIFGIIGARAYYVIFNWNLYADDILSIFKFWEGGLAIHGGIILGLITMWIYCKRYDVRLERMTDVIVPSLILAQAIGRWGNFFNSEAHGAATTLIGLQSKFVPRFIIDGMYINGVYYEPTFYYESILCLIGFIIMLILRRKNNTKIGSITSFYLIWYGCGRFIIENLRTDSLMFMGFKVAQIVSALMVVVGLIWAMIISRKPKLEDIYNKELETEIRF